jgi:hypothetical protein
VHAHARRAPRSLGFIEIQLLSLVRCPAHLQVVFMDRASSDLARPVAGTPREEKALVSGLQAA